MTGTATGGSGGASAAAGMSAGCGKTPTIASSMYNNGTRIPITVGTMQRRYILNVPKNYDSSKPYRLIIAFHELNGNDVQMYQNGYYHLMPLDTAGTTIFVAPNGQNNGTPCAGTEQRRIRVRVAEPEQPGLRAGGRGRAAGRTELLRRHESNLRDRLELRRRDVV